MKLKNLLFGSMIALAFTACSDNDPGLTPENPVDGKTVLDLRYEGVTSKAADDDVTSLQVLVFNTAGALEKNFSKTDANVSENNVITTGVKSVFVLANAPAVESTTLAGVLEETKGFATPLEAVGTANALTMNSQLFENVNIVEGVNKIGYGNPASGQTWVNAYPALTTAVKLYRNVAKINLMSVSLGSKLGANNDKYPKPKFEVTDIFVLHARANTKIVGEDGALWGPTMTADDADKTDWLNGVIATDGATEKPYGYNHFDLGKLWNKLGDDYDYNAALASSERFTLNYVSESEGTITKSFGNGLPFYVYENQIKNEEKPIHTLLVLEGTFSYEVKAAVMDGDVEVTPAERYSETRYYTVAPGASGKSALVDGEDMSAGYTLPAGYVGMRDDDTAATTKYIGVLRNLQYNLYLTISGIGYKSPFGPPVGGETVLDVKVEVAPWGVVTQYDDIE